VYQNGEREEVDISLLKANIITDLYKNSQEGIEQKNRIIQQLTKENSALKTNQELFTQIPAELSLLFPNMKDIELSWGSNREDAEHNRSGYKLILNAHSSSQMKHKEQRQIQEWLKTRTNNPHVAVYLH